MPYFAPAHFRPLLGRPLVGQAARRALEVLDVGARASGHRPSIAALVTPSRRVALLGEVQLVALVERVRVAERLEAAVRVDEGVEVPSRERTHLLVVLRAGDSWWRARACADEDNPAPPLASRSTALVSRFIVFHRRAVREVVLAAHQDNNTRRVFEMCPAFFATSHTWRPYLQVHALWPLPPSPQCRCRRWGAAGAERVARYRGGWWPATATGGRAWQAPPGRHLLSGVVEKRARARRRQQKAAGGGCPSGLMIRPVGNWHCEAERIRRTQEPTGGPVVETGPAAQGDQGPVEAPHEDGAARAVRLGVARPGRPPAHLRAHPRPRGRPAAHRRGGARRPRAAATRRDRGRRGRRARAARWSGAAAGHSEVQARLEAGRASVAPGERARRAERALRRTACGKKSCGRRSPSSPPLDDRTPRRAASRREPRSAASAPTCSRPTSILADGIRSIMPRHVRRRTLTRRRRAHDGIPRGCSAVAATAAAGSRRRRRSR